MALTAYFNDPFLSEMEKTMDRVMHRTFGNSLPAPLHTPLGSRAPRAVVAPAAAIAMSGHFAIAMDIVESADSYELVADAPGMGPDDIKVELHDGALTISGARKVGHESKDAASKVWRAERASYSFTRSFTLPDNANPDDISAAMDKGVLKVTVAKKPQQAPPPKPEPKRITVTSSL